MKGDSIMKNPKKSTVISIINLKGGVGKTITAINMAHCLAVFHDLKVLIIDNDKQGNTSKFFGCHSYDNENIADVLLLKCKMKDVIQKTAFENIDIIPSNMRLLQANKEVLLDSTVNHSKIVSYWGCKAFLVNMIFVFSIMHPILI